MGLDEIRKKAEKSKSVGRLHGRPSSSSTFSNFETQERYGGKGSNKRTGGRYGTLDEGSYIERNSRNQQDVKIHPFDDLDRIKNVTSSKKEYKRPLRPSGRVKPDHEATRLSAVPLRKSETSNIRTAEIVRKMKEDQQKDDEQGWTKLNNDRKKRKQPEIEKWKKTSKKRKSAESAPEQKPHGKPMKQKHKKQAEDPEPSCSTEFIISSDSDDEF